MNEGDIVFAKRGRSEILGRGIVRSSYRYEMNRKLGLYHVREVEWTHNGSWKSPDNIATKTLTDITSLRITVRALNALFDEEPTNGELDIEPKKEEYPPYTKEDFLSIVYMDEEKYQIIRELLRRKKNIILQGPPGTGKTFAAQKLAYSIMGKEDPDRIRMIQFHQSYSYEDFIMGYRPNTEGGFDLVEGSFYQFCQEAIKDDEENPYFFIIDEINRGNLSKIFGELFTLIESDKRGMEIELVYGKELFNIPKNIYIIGLMNTADRSLAMLDYALRRRFAFVQYEPAFDHQGFLDYVANSGNSKFQKLIKEVKNLNNDIEEDATLGKDYLIGHSYFITSEEVTDDWLRRVIHYELYPLLKEYWFDDAEKATSWRDQLLGALHDTN